MDAIVFGPRRRNTAAERENVVGERVIGRGRDGVPIVAVSDGVGDVAVKERARIRVGRLAADMLDAPCERQRAALGLLIEAHLLVAAYSFFVPGWHWARERIYPTPRAAETRVKSDNEHLVSSVTWRRRAPRRE